MTDKKMFAVSVLASKPSAAEGGRLLVHHTVFVVEAAGRWEAQGMGVAIGEVVFPKSEGWQNHHASVCATSNVVTPEDACRVDKPIV